VTSRIHSGAQRRKRCVDAANMCRVVRIACTWKTGCWCRADTSESGESHTHMGSQPWNPGLTMIYLIQGFTEAPTIAEGNKVGTCIRSFRFSNGTKVCIYGIVTWCASTYTSTFPTTAGHVLPSQDMCRVSITASWTPDATTCSRTSGWYQVAFGEHMS
jgi:hypothetical protein